MDLETTVKVSRLGYASLYNTRFEVLHHLFCVLGNGYHWLGGELVAQDADESKSAAFEIVTCRCKHPMPFDTIDREIEAARACGGRTIWDLGPAHFHWYPLCNLSTLMNVPDNVKPDWKAGAIEIAEIMAEATEEWSSEHALKNRRFARRVLEKLKGKP